jgi:hypothetical protein
MPQKIRDTEIPTIRVAKDNGTFVLKDEKGFIYDLKIFKLTKKAADDAAKVWNDYYTSSQL